MKGRVMVGLSGGVDSAVAACLLKRQGHEVAGLTMCLGTEVRDEDRGRRCSPREVEEAERVCRHLGIPHHVVDLTDELETWVIKPFIAEYGAGRTPNPCVECNRRIKFGTLLELVCSMGFDYLATGHYAGISETGAGFRLVLPRDSRKDQTYFLSGVPRQSLCHVIFPLAALTKDEVRRTAADEGIPASMKRESQDLCFIPRGGTGDFLSKRLSPCPGDIVDRDGRQLGTHRGLAFYTIGQRARMSVNWGRGLYVLDKDVPGNRIIAGDREQLFSQGLIADRVNLLTDRWPERASAKIRYAHAPAPCSVSPGNGTLAVTFDAPQEAVTPGQTVALYKDGIVLGSGVIREAIR